MNQTQEKPKRTRRKKPEADKIKSHYVRINQEIFDAVKTMADQTGTSPRKLIEYSILRQIEIIQPRFDWDKVLRACHPLPRKK